MTDYHFIGIGGTGLSAIARVLVEQGHSVTGSDVILSPLAHELQDLGVKVTIGHHAENVTEADMVIRSSAIPDDNVEVIAAHKAGIPVLKRADFLGELTKNRTLIAIAGTHGKTTTTAMMAWTLVCMGEDPSYIIGGVSKNLKSNAHAGQGKYFVIEADEYDGMFLGLHPDTLIVTSIEYDHPDYYPTPQVYFEAFIELLKHLKTGGNLLVCKDHPQASRLSHFAQTGIRIFSYGTNPDADFVAGKIEHNPACGAKFSVIHPADFNLSNLQLQVPGEHNVRNALSVIVAAYLNELNLEKARTALESFIGVGRRFDIIGIANRVTIIDDYGHHPTEINTTLSAARCRFPGQPLWVVWQPHTYSRTKSLIDDFGRAFNNCDHVILTEIYRSREKQQEYSSAEVALKINHPDVRFIPDFSSIIRYLTDHLSPGDVLLVFSAGDADQISSQVLANLKQIDKPRATHE